MPWDKTSDSIVRRTIQEHSKGRQLTPEAIERAVDHARTVSNGGRGQYNWGQLADIGIAHATAGVLKK